MTSPAPEISFATRVAEATGLAGMIAFGAVVRSCKRAGVDASELNHRNLRKVLPILEPLLELYLAPPDLAERVAALRCLAR